MNRKIPVSAADSRLGKLSMTAHDTGKSQKKILLMLGGISTLDFNASVVHEENTSEWRSFCLVTNVI